MDTIKKAVLIINNSLMLMVVLMIALGIGFFKFMDANSAQVRPSEGEVYVDEQVWGPKVIRVGNCSYSKYSANCWVMQEGKDWEYRNMKAWPGGTIQVGDILGTNYRVGEKAVEKWNIRKGHPKMGYRSACFKTDKDCYWPSKNKKRPN